MTDVEVPEDIERAQISAERSGNIWRAVALIQIPLTFIAVFMFLTNFIKGDTIIDVDEERPAGHYPASEIANKEFVNVAQRVVNLIATYQPVNARLQFQTAREYFSDEALPMFDQNWVDRELATSESSGISQVFWPDPNLMQVRRPDKGDVVIVRIPGIKARLAGSQKLSEEEVVYDFKLVTGEPAEANRYGIRITAVDSKAKPLRVVEEENKRVTEDEKADPKDRRRKNRRRSRGKDVPEPTVTPERPLTF